jgi:hypothetical protein
VHDDVGEGWMVVWCWIGDTEAIRYGEVLIREGVRVALCCGRSESVTRPMQYRYSAVSRCVLVLLMLRGENVVCSAQISIHCTPIYGPWLRFDGNSHSGSRRPCPRPAIVVDLSRW